MTSPSWLSQSLYVEVRDGTKLAVEIYFPAIDGSAVANPLPVVWTYDCYHHSPSTVNGVDEWLDRLPWLRDALGDNLMRLVEEAEKNLPSSRLEQTPWLQTLVEHQYIVAFVDVRGTGNSFGTKQAPLTEEEALDTYDMTEWFAAQPWCTGSVGMFGRSYLGVTQFLAASTSPPHLKAIFPEMALFDLYSFARPGGLFRHDFATNWSRALNASRSAPLTESLDNDAEGALLRQAREQHLANRDLYEMFVALPHRDSQDSPSGMRPYIDCNPARRLEEIRRSGVPIYHLAGWRDPLPRDAFLWFRNLDNPQRLIIGPWAHTGSVGIDLAEEHLRWYDYWLKDIDTGITEEAPIHFYTIGAPPGTAWKETWHWPPLEASPTRYYLHQGRSGAIKSVNDGLLLPTPPLTQMAQDDYTVDFTTSSGRATRWTNAYGGPFGYPDMAENDAKGLTYTTPPLSEMMEVTGHPLLHVWVSCDAGDIALFANLEEVDPDGYSNYVTEGALLASHRLTHDAPFDNLGLPYHRSYAQDEAPLTGEPVELVFDLHPISIVFQEGSRIRLTLTCADKDNVLTPAAPNAPVMTVYRNSVYSSFLILPVIPSSSA
jgi:putative CocE/NonD family hydrolase